MLLAVRNIRPAKHLAEATARRKLDALATRRRKKARVAAARRKLLISLASTRLRDADKIRPIAARYSLTYHACDRFTNFLSKSIYLFSVSGPTAPTSTNDRPISAISDISRISAVTTDDFRDANTTMVSTSTTTTGMRDLIAVVNKL